jgi:hypothetical protein
MHLESKNLVEYIILVTGLLVLLTLFVIFRYDDNILILLSGLGSIFYAGWGIIHHAVNERLTKVIAAEYLVVGLLVFLLLFTVLSI